MLELEMVPRHFLETKAEQQNSDTLSCYAVDLQTLSPHHLSTGCAIFREMAVGEKNQEVW